MWILILNLKTAVMAMDSNANWMADKLNDNFRLTAEAINLFSEPKEQFAFVQDDLYEVNDYGPRVFFGIRGRF